MAINFYLKQLVLQNFATFKNQTIEFRTGLNSIIGETGSGKSLVLDALQLILGARSDKKIVRKDTEYALIEATFYCQDNLIKEFLEAEGYPIDGDEISIKRLIYKNGINKNYFNHLSCTLTFLTHFSKNFVDLVGQFENQKLLSENYQLKLLDQFGKLQPEVLKFQELHSEYKSLVKQKILVEESKSYREQRLDYLNYQIQEIEKLNPSLQEEEDLLTKKNILINYEKNQKLSAQLESVFEGGEGQTGLLSQVKSLNYILLKNAEIFKGSHEITTLIEDQLIELQFEIQKQLDFELDPSELEGILEKLDQYQKLKKKFGGSVESIIQMNNEFLKEVAELNKIETNLNDIEARIESINNQTLILGRKLHQERLKFSVRLSNELTKKVQNLNMKGASIRLTVEVLDHFTDSGMSRIYFEAQTNPGEGYFKVKDIASGGELSRILLAVRQILSGHDSISIFLFDEIDTGIGGETAIYIGKALEQVATNGQVIAITHLPQIAQFSETLIIVEKSIQEKSEHARTESITKQFIGKSILKEVKQMIHLQ